MGSTAMKKKTRMCHCGRVVGNDIGWNPAARGRVRIFNVWPRGAAFRRRRHASRRHLRHICFRLLRGRYQRAGDAIRRNYHQLRDGDQCSQATNILYVPKNKVLDGTSGAVCHHSVWTYRHRRAGHRRPRQYGLQSVDGKARSHERPRAAWLVADRLFAHCVRPSRRSDRKIQSLTGFSRTSASQARYRCRVSNT